MLLSFLSCLPWNEERSWFKRALIERRQDFMKDIFGVGFSVETRRQFIKRNGLLMASVFDAPPAGLRKRP